MPTKSTERDERRLNALMRLLAPLDRWLFRWSGGNARWRIIGNGMPALLLTTIGRKSGQPRTTPVVYIRDGESFVIAASKGGMPHHPQWYLNLITGARVEVEVDGRKLALVARQASEAEKRRLWPKLVAMNPYFDVYQARTDRDIPVVILSPLEKTE